MGSWIGWLVGFACCLTDILVNGRTGRGLTGSGGFMDGLDIFKEGKLGGRVNRHSGWSDKWEEWIGVGLCGWVGWGGEWLHWLVCRDGYACMLVNG
jgi:hypothetical protein